MGVEVWTYLLGLKMFIGSSGTKDVTHPSKVAKVRPAVGEPVVEQQSQKSSSQKADGNCDNGPVYSVCKAVARDPRRSAVLFIGFIGLRDRSVLCWRYTVIEHHDRDSRSGQMVDRMGARLGWETRPILTWKPTPQSQRFKIYILTGLGWHQRALQPSCMEY
ncbi:hypothetical protein BJX96DRAFT_6508 [Aspergillus floccosus]